MNIEQLQLVNRNVTSNILLKLLSTMEQKSDETSLEGFFNHLVKKGNNINKVEYYNFFKDLESIEINNIPIGYISPNGIFKWNYCFRDVSEQTLFPNKIVNIKLLNQPQQQVEDLQYKKDPSLNVVNVPKNEKKEIQMSPVKKGRGRPKGSRNKKEANSQSRQRPTVDEITPKPLTNNIGKEVVFAFTNSKGRTQLFNLDDAEQLIKQVQDIKQQLG